ncbi:MAG: hypothetical protein F6J93_15540 [Oscillatoria sp. SIO1A7]|nr:hypothetical protein [Oscillatoria sp. SIO1A7]
MRNLGLYVAHRSTPPPHTPHPTPHTPHPTPHTPATMCQNYPCTATYKQKTGVSHRGGAI